MPSVRVRIATFAFAFSIIGSELVPGQTPPPMNAGQQFSAIQATLALAADSALNSAGESDLQPHQQDLAAPGAPAPQSREVNLKSRPITEGIEGIRPVVGRILAKEGIPDELAAVILVESAGNPWALSNKGARGLWQLMPDTARRYGLVVDERRDERIDLEKSTTGAARYLHDLYNQFGSWPLALAAYNTGEKNLQRAIARAHTRDFATLGFLGYLPTETRNYVPDVLAAMETTVPSAIANSPIESVTESVYALSAH